MDESYIYKSASLPPTAITNYQEWRRKLNDEDMSDCKSLNSSFVLPLDPSLPKELASQKGTLRHHGPRVKKDLRRIVFQNGDINVKFVNTSRRHQRYLADIFTTLVDIKWRYTLMVFALSFILEWLLFGLIWWILAFIHGDFEPVNIDNPNWVPCVRELYNFASCFLFSIETQHTIGYGVRHTTEECIEAIFVMSIQSILGVLTQAFMVGVVFSKLARPTKRTETILFSRNAVICQRDGQLCFIFRVGDMRKTTIIEAHVRAQLVSRKYTKEGELISNDQTTLKVGFDGEEDRFMFIWPTLVIHHITPDSPLYGISASSLFKQKFQILVTVEGISESTSSSLQARTSYLPGDILWGHRFEPIMKFDRGVEEFVVDFTTFNSTLETNTPLCSAKELDLFNSAIQERSRLASRASSISRKKRAKDENEVSTNFGHRRYAVEESSCPSLLIDSPKKVVYTVGPLEKISVAKKHRTKA